MMEFKFEISTARFYSILKTERMQCEARVIVSSSMSCCSVFVLNTQLQSINVKTSSTSLQTGDLGIWMSILSMFVPDHNEVTI